MTDSDIRQRLANALKAPDDPPVHPPRVRRRIERMSALMPLANALFDRLRDDPNFHISTGPFEDEFHIELERGNRCEIIDIYPSSEGTSFEVCRRFMQSDRKQECNRLDEDATIEFIIERVKKHVR